MASCLAANMEEAVFPLELVKNEKDETASVSECWPTPETTWSSLSYSNEIERIKLPIMNVASFPDPFVASWTYLMHDPAALDDERTYDSIDAFEWEGIPTPDEFSHEVFDVDIVWVAPMVWQCIPYLDDEYLNGTFYVAPDLAGPVECEGLPTPEEFFFSSTLM